MPKPIVALTTFCTVALIALAWRMVTTGWHVGEAITAWLWFAAMCAITTGGLWSLSKRDGRQS